MSFRPILVAAQSRNGFAAACLLELWVWILLVAQVSANVVFCQEQVFVIGQSFIQRSPTVCVCVCVCVCVSLNVIKCNN